MWLRCFLTALQGPRSWSWQGLSALKAAQVGFSSGLVHAGAGLLLSVCAGSEPTAGVPGTERQEGSFIPQREGLRLLHLSAASKLLSLSSTQLHYLRLPKDISEDHVILMDCTVSTGAAAMMAVRVLLVRTVSGRGLALEQPPKHQPQPC